MGPYFNAPLYVWDTDYLGTLLEPPCEALGYFQALWFLRPWARGDLGVGVGLP